MKRVHPLLIVAALVVVIGAAVAWNEGRRGYDDARAAAPAPEEPGAPVPPPGPAPEAAPPAPVEDHRLVRARALVIERLKDPDSAQFRNERFMPDGTICLEVNAKNGFGGYTGFSHAVVISGSAGDPVAWVDSEPQGIASAACKPA